MFQDATLILSVKLILTQCLFLELSTGKHGVFEGFYDYSDRNRLTSTLTNTADTRKHQTAKLTSYRPSGSRTRLACGTPGIPQQGASLVCHSRQFPASRHGADEQPSPCTRRCRTPVERTLMKESSEWIDRPDELTGRPIN